MVEYSPIQEVSSTGLPYCKCTFKIRVRPWKPNTHLAKIVKKLNLHAFLVTVEATTCHDNKKTWNLHYSSFCIYLYVCMSDLQPSEQISPSISHHCVSSFALSVLLSKYWFMDPPFHPDLKLLWPILHPHPSKFNWNPCFFIICTSKPEELEVMII